MADRTYQVTERTVVVGPSRTRVKLRCIDGGRWSFALTWGPVRIESDGVYGSSEVARQWAERAVVALEALT